MKTIETGACILHSIHARTTGEKPDVSPIEAVIMGVYVGIRTSAVGSLPPLCGPCERQLRGTLAANGILLADMTREQADHVKETTGSRFIPVSILPPGSKDSS